MTAAAQQLQVSPAVIRKLIASALLPAKQVVEHAPWVIKREDLELKEVQEYIEAVHAGKRIPRRDHNQDSLPL